MKVVRSRRILWIYFRVEPRGSSNGLDMRCEKKAGVQNDSRTFGVARRTECHLLKWRKLLEG